MNTVTEFQGKYRFLSNFWKCDIEYGANTYPSVEHAYQASKTHDEGFRFMISRVSNPGKAKRLGFRVKKRSDWNDVKLDIMESLLVKKFSIPKLKALLLSTGDAILEEGNTWRDRYWGIYNGEGENHLGRLIMEIRDRITL